MSWKKYSLSQILIERKTMEERKVVISKSLFQNLNISIKKKLIEFTLTFVIER